MRIQNQISNTRWGGGGLSGERRAARCRFSCLPFAGDAVVIEALRAMLMARARYDILRYQELALVVSDFGVLLLDSHSITSASSAVASSSQWHHVKLVLALEHVTHYAIHKDNNRLVFTSISICLVPVRVRVRICSTHTQYRGDVC